MTRVPDGNDVSYDGDDENHPHLDFPLKEPIDQV